MQELHVLKFVVYILSSTVFTHQPQLPKINHQLPSYPSEAPLPPISGGDFLVLLCFSLWQKGAVGGKELQDSGVPLPRGPRREGTETPLGELEDTAQS